MSKSERNTKETILYKALELFNERGIEYVGLRELAVILDIRVSNITYYFPTKDDLVYAISQKLNEDNSKVMVENPDMNLKGFLEMMHKVFINHAKYRCLLLSFVHIMEQNKVIAARYHETQKRRAYTIDSSIDRLVKSGSIRLKYDDSKFFLVSAISLISRFWISEAAISLKHMDTEEQIKHYLNLLTQLLLPYATAYGKKEIVFFLKEFDTPPGKPVKAATRQNA